MDDLPEKRNLLVDDDCEIEVDPRGKIDSRIGDTSADYGRSKSGSDVKESEEELANEFYGNKDKKDRAIEGEMLNDALQGTGQVPMSPGKRILYYAGSPARFVKRQVAPGSVNSSIFSLVIICLGAGSVTIPYIYYELGFALGSFGIIFGGAMSCFCGYLLAHCTMVTNGTCFEDIAEMTLGRWGKILTIICMFGCNIGFTASYFVFFKSGMPYTIQNTFGVTLPAWCDDTLTGQLFWGVTFGIFIVFPLSLPRNLSALRFTSAFSVVISFYIVLVVFFLSILNKGSSVSVKEGFQRGHQEVQMSVKGVFTSLPLVIFAFMYQINIPAIYCELKVKSMEGMRNVLVGGTLFATICYMVIGIFGYIAFTGGNITDECRADIFAQENILYSPWRNGTGDDAKSPPSLLVCLFGILIVVSFASPFCVLPSKDSLEAVLKKPGEKFNFKENVIYTAVVVLASMCLALPFTSLGSIATILGATTNTAVGFLLPIGYYLKAERKRPNVTADKIVCYCIFVFVCCSSIITLFYFFQDLANGTLGASSSDTDPCEKYF